MCWRIWRNIFINWKIVTLKKKKIVIVTTFCQKYHKVQEVSFHLCPHGLNLFEDRQHRDMNFALDKNLLCSRKIASFWITSFPLINPIRPGLLGCIKSRRGEEGYRKPHFWKPSSDCQNALKFGLSNIWDISFCLKVLWLILCINMHNMSKY